MPINWNEVRQKNGVAAAAPSSSSTPSTGINWDEVKRKNGVAPTPMQTPSVIKQRTEPQAIHPKNTMPSNKLTLGKVVEAVKRLPSALMNKDTQQAVRQPVWDAIDNAQKFTDVTGARMRQKVFGDNRPYDEGWAPTTGNKTADTIADAAGTVESFFMPTGSGSSFAGAANTASKAIAKKILPGVIKGKALPIVRRVAQGMIESVPYSAQQIATQKEIDTPEKAFKTVGGNALLGMGTELGMMGAGALIKAITGKLKSGIALSKVEVETVKSTPELRALPEAKQYLMLEAPKLRTPDVIEGLPPKPTAQEINVLNKPVRTVNEPTSMGNKGNTLPPANQPLQLKAGRQTNIYVNPYGVADAKPVNQLQLPEPTNTSYYRNITFENGMLPTKARQIERPFATIKGDLKKSQLPQNITRQSDTIPKYQQAMGRTENIYKGAPKQTLPKFKPNKIPDAADLQNKAEIFAKKQQYDAAATNIGYNVPEQYRRETPMTVSRSTVPPKVQGRFAKESFGEVQPGINKILRAELVVPTAKTLPKKKIVGAEPDIPAGKKERGFSANTRTDVNNPDALRDSYSENPLTYEQLGNPTTLAKAQAVFDQGYEAARSQLSGLAERMQPEAVPLAKMLSRQATETGNIQGAREILSDVAERLTQAGQFSQAAKLLRESDPETFLMTIGKQLKKLNKEGLETYGKKWKDFDLTPDELSMISKIERGNQTSYESAFEAIQKRIANEMPASAMEKVNAWRHMSMLLNPKTHIRNVTGNAIMLGMRKTAQRVSGVGQKAFLKAEDRTQAVFINKDYKRAANDYFEANKKDLLSGANKYNENLTLNMPDKRVFKNNIAEGARKFNYKLLELGDTRFFKNAYVDRLASYAQAKGIKDFSKLGQEAFDIAKREAEQATYKDASKIASFLNGIKHPGANANFGQKVGATVAEAALPFTKTPINIIKRGIQYSPAGIVNGLSKIKSTEGAAAAIDEMAKGVTGTGILGLGYLLASKGVLTGKAESDKDLADYNRNTGNSPFSVLGKYSYDWAQPFAVPLTIGVEIYNAVKDSPEDAKKLDALIEKNDTTGLQQMAQKFAIGLLDSFNASGDTVFNMSFMKGIRQLLGSGTNGVMEGLAQLPQNYATQFIPTVFNQAAGMIDPTVRQSYVKGNAVESAKAAALSKIPFASRALEPKQTPWGEDVKRNENPLIRAFSQFLSPGIVAQPQNINPEVDAELRRLNKMGETIHFPTIANNKFTWKGQSFNLSPQEYTDFQKTLGQNTLAAYTDYIKTPEYKALNDSEKASELSAIISDARDLAKFQLIQSKGLAQSPEIMSVPDSFTINKTEFPMTFEQQNELADKINKYKKLYGLNKNMTKERADKAAKDRAYAEMKRKLYAK